MQQRRIKRLAGPAFYVNVKYDQSLAADHKKSRKPKHPKYNNYHDWELFDIKEGEIVVCRNDHRHRDHFARVISSLNGALDATDGEDTLLDNYTFFGVAQTEHVAVKEPKINQGLVSAVGGLATIINDHDEHNISPGDMLYLAPPSSSVSHRGIPKDKKRFCLKPDPDYNANQDFFNGIGLAAAEYNAGKMGKEDFKTVLEGIIKRRKRPVAKALSHARKGERLDILLHPRQPAFYSA